MGKKLNPELLTPVYPPGTKPARPGVYLTHTPEAKRYAKWTGEVWMAQKATPQMANMCITLARHRNKPWQGLKEKPSA